MAAASSLPTLVVDGFSWAENLIFDGVGNMFVSEARRGELWKINLCEGETNYCKKLYLSKGFDGFGGLAVTPDGENIYAAVTFDDNLKGIIYASTSFDGTGEPSYQVLLKTEHQPNGLQISWKSNMLYYTHEGKPSFEGEIRSVDLKTLEDKLIMTKVPGADGCWLDETTDLLYIGDLVTRKMYVFNVADSAAPTLVQEFPGMGASINHLHVLDDLTLFNGTNSADLSQTYVLGADWSGRAIRLYSLDGTYNQVIAPPEGIDLFPPTSVRWGKGPGFDANSVYVTESGGVSKKTTNRRVVQFKMG